MKKLTGFIVTLICALSMSCTDKKEQTTKETIIVPEKTTVVKEPQKSTNVSVDKNGIKVETKKVKVSIQ